MQGQPKFSLSEEQISSIIEAMKTNVEVVPQIELTPENWLAEFGTEGIVATPIGEVIMGEHQYKKLVDNKRSNDFGKVKPTLTNPDIVLEEYDPEEGALRDTKFLFIKAFAKPNGEKIIYFTSVTVKQKSGEVSISSHRIKNEKKVKEKMHNDNVMHLKETLLDSEVRLTKPQSEGSDLVPTPSVISKSKDTTSIPENLTNVGKYSFITPELDASYLEAVERGDIILLNGGMLITSGDAHRSTMHEYAHSITKKYLGERLAEVTASILETEIDKARKEMLP